MNHPRYPLAAASIPTLLLGVGASAIAGQQPLPGWKTDFTKHTVPLEEIVSGGPPKDGIPAIDAPNFESVRAADRWLDRRDPVILVRIGDVAKAYPLGILIMHEIVNDMVGETPVSVTYCPLCNTALAFDRRFDDRLLDFGTTGRLRHSDLVMYDRQTETWWQQATGEGIVGHYAGEQLTFIPAPTISWESFKENFPDGDVLSRDTGYPRLARWYGNNPYEAYDRRRSPLAHFFSGRTDNRLEPMERVVAVGLGGEYVAYPFSSLRERRAVNDEIAGVPVAVLWSPGTASAVDEAIIADGRDVGSSAVYDRRLDGRTLTFEAADAGTYRDRETGSTWNLLGEAIEGPRRGQRLKPIVHGNHFWFAWWAFRPETRLER